MQQWTRLKNDEAEHDLNLALVVDAELFRLDAAVRWLDAAGARLSRSGGTTWPASAPAPSVSAASARASAADPGPPSPPVAAAAAAARSRRRPRVGGR